MITVWLHLKNQSQPITYEHVKNTYEKESFFCIYTEEELVFKYPVEDIWRITEQYGKHLNNSKDI
jgi:hypothetical protein